MPPVNTMIYYVFAAGVLGPARIFEDLLQLLNQSTNQYTSLFLVKTKLNHKDDTYG